MFIYWSYIDAFCTQLCAHTRLGTHTYCCTNTHLQWLKTHLLYNRFQQTDQPCSVQPIRGKCVSVCTNVDLLTLKQVFQAPCIVQGIHLGTRYISLQPAAVPCAGWLPLHAAGGKYLPGLHRQYNIVVHTMLDMDFFRPGIHFVQATKRLTRRTNTRTHIHKYTCMYNTRTHIHKYTCTYNIRTHIHKYTCTYKYIVQIHIFTYTYIVHCTLYIIHQQNTSYMIYRTIVLGCIKLQCIDWYCIVLYYIYITLYCIDVYQIIVYCIVVYIASVGLTTYNVLYCIVSYMVSTIPCVGRAGWSPLHTACGYKPCTGKKLSTPKHNQRELGSTIHLKVLTNR